MAAGEEIDLTGLDKQIKQANRDIQDMFRSFEQADKKVTDFNKALQGTDVGLKNLATLQKFMSSLSGTLEKGIGKGNKALSQLNSELINNEPSVARFKSSMTEVIGLLAKFNSSLLQSKATNIKGTKSFLVDKLDVEKIRDSIENLVLVYQRSRNALNDIISSEKEVQKQRLASANAAKAEKNAIEGLTLVSRQEPRYNRAQRRATLTEMIDSQVLSEEKLSQSVQQSTDSFAKQAAVVSGITNQMQEQVAKEEIKTKKESSQVAKEETKSLEEQLAIIREKVAAEQNFGKWAKLRHQEKLLEQQIEQRNIRQQKEAEIKRFSEQQKINDAKSAELKIEQELEKRVRKGDSSAVKNYLKIGLSIERINNALAGLRAAQERCNLATKDGQQQYARLGQQIKSLEFMLGRNANIAEKLSSAFSKSKSMVEQLAMSFGVMTGVFGATNFVKQLYKITAEFQLQQRALGAIINNTREANVLFKQMQSLAVESPMKFMDLNRYAKQLAAFRIETNELYNSLKMLGDISVGVGVDMDRLILAYGQVKAANYLRGQELRQFSEAGVNILGGLQEYYRETKNINMSINEIFDSVSKRKVLFEDVDAVLHRMTQSGGEFYNMQLIQSQTLYGQLQKLGDLFQISMNKIGTSTSGVLLKIITSIQFFIKHLREVVSIMTAIVGARFASRIIRNIMTIRGGLAGLNIQLQRAWKISRAIGTTRFLGLINGLHSGALAANALSIALQAAAAAFAFFLARHQEAKAKREEIQSSIVEEISEYNKRMSEMKTLEQAYSNDKTFSGRLALLQQLIEKAKEYKMALEIDENITQSNIDKNFESASKQIEEYTHQVLLYKSALYSVDVNEALEKLNATNIEFANASLGYQNMMNMLIGDYEHLSDEQKKMVDNLREIDEAFSKNEEEAVKKYKMTNEQWKIARLERMQIMAGITTNAQNITVGGRSVQGLSEAQNTFLKNAVTDLTKFTNSYKKALANAKKELEPAIKKVISPDDFVGTEEEYKKAVQTKISAVIDAFADAGEFAKQNIPDIVSDILELDKSYTATIIFEAQKSKTDATNTNLQRLIDDIANSDENGYVRTLVYDVEIKRTGDLPDFIGTQVEAEQALIDPLQQVNEERQKELETAMRIVKAVQDAVGGEKEKEKTFKDEVQKYQEYLKLIERGKKNQIEEEVIKTRMNQLMGTQFHTLQDMINYINTELSNAKIFGDRMLYEWPEDKSSSTRAKSMKSEYQSMIDFVRELNREFDTLRKNFNENDSARWAGATNRILSSFEAKFGAMPAKFKKAFQDTLSSIDFTTKEGTVNAENIVKGLIDSAKDLTKKEKEELQRAWGEAVGQIKLEAELELKAREDERLKAQVQKMFDDYNLTVELKKMQINVDEVTDLFGITKRNLSEIEQKLMDMREDFIGQNMEKEYRQYWRKLQEIQDKANLEMSKKYLKYLRNEYNERAKIELDYMKQRAEVYALPFDEDETMRILENLRKETDEKLAKIDWDEFIATDYYIEMFEDLETVSSRSINTMISKLDEMKSSLKGLSPTELKTMTEQIQKLKDELVDRNPFKALAESMKELRSMKTDANFTTLIAKYLGEGEDGDQKLRSFSRRVDRAIDIVEQKISENQSKINILEPLIDAAKTKQKDIESLNIPVDIDISQVNEKISQLDRQIERFSIGGDDIAENEYMQQRQQEVQKMIEERQLYAEILSMMQQIEESGAKIGVSSSMSVAELLELWKNLTNEVKTYTNDVGNMKKAQKELTKQQKALVKMSELFKQIAESSKQTFDNIMDNLDYLGGATDEVTDAWKDFGDAIFDTITGALGMIPTLVAGFTTAGLEINAAMGIIGLIAEAIQLVITLITALAKVHDARIEKKIQNIQKSCDKLKKTIDELSEAFDNLYNEDKLRQFDAAIIKSRELYIANLNAMIDAERQKKKVDQEQIDGWLDEIDTANKEMQEGIENFYEALGGFGSAANMKSTVEEWTDAWYEAFKETGDGLSGLEDSFEEFFENIVKKTLMNNIMAKYFGEDFLSGLDKILGTEGGVMGNLDALNDWITQYHDLAVQADEEMQAATQAIQNVTGIGGGLEGLQASLQGMTEETADILAAYLNSVRFYVADNNQLLQNLLNGLTIDNNSNPMLQQLKIVAAQTTSINLLLDSVVHSGGYQGNGGGSYLKVHAILES